MSDNFAPTLFALVIDRYLASHSKPLAEAYPDGCWEFTAGKFAFAMNGHTEAKKGGPADGMQPDVPPFTLDVFSNGWLLGFVDPGGGVLMEGAEDDIIKALKEDRR